MELRLVNLKVANVVGNITPIMSELRVYNSGKRVATAVTLQGSAVYQVYPEKKHFATEQEWRDLWKQKIVSGIKFEAIPKKKPEPYTGPYWRCAICKKGGGVSHQVCVIDGFQRNLRLWQDAWTWEMPNKV